MHTYRCTYIHTDIHATPKVPSVEVAQNDMFEWAKMTQTNLDKVIQAKGKKNYMEKTYHQDTMHLGNLGGSYAGTYPLHYYI